jgi:hypothetical protein
MTQAFPYFGLIFCRCRRTHGPVAAVGGLSGVCNRLCCDRSTGSYL